MEGQKVWQHLSLPLIASGSSVLFFKKNSKLNDPTPSDLYDVGTLARIERMVKAEGEINAQVKGLIRVKILSIEEHDAFLVARVVEIPEVIDNSPQTRALCNHLINQFRRAMNIGKSVDFLVFMNIMSQNSPMELANLIGSVLDIRPSERQMLLEISNVGLRLEKIAELLAKELKILELELRIASKTQERFEKRSTRGDVEGET